jgi:hypothetical protein
MHDLPFDFPIAEKHNLSESYSLCADVRPRFLDWQVIETFNLLARSGSLALVTYNGRRGGLSTQREKRMKAKMAGRISPLALQPIHPGLGTGGGCRIQWERADSNLQTRFSQAVEYRFN